MNISLENAMQLKAGYRVWVEAGLAAVLAVRQDLSGNSRRMTSDDFDLAPCGLVLLASSGLIARANRTFLEWTGFTSGELVGQKSLTDLMDEKGAQFFANLTQALARHGKLEEVFVLLFAKSGEPVPAYLHIGPSHDAEGAAAGMSIAAFRGEHRALREAALRRGKLAAEQLAAIVANSTDAIVSVDKDGVVLTANRAFSDIFLYEPRELAGARLVDLIVPEDCRQHFNEKLKQAGRQQVKSKIVRRRRKDGKFIELSLSTAPIHDEAGEVTAISAIYRDVAPLMRAAEHIEFLLREVNHRSKNMLAVVQAVARQTARLAETPELFIESFMARLAAIASSHDLLVSRDWRGVQIADLTRSQFDHLDPDARERISVEGDFIEINPRAAESYGLALHELSTNAARHGALSGPSGSVELRFELDTESKTYTLTWRERGGPGVGKPERAGFGHSVLTRMAPLAIHGESALDFSPDGVAYRLSAPVAQIRMNR
jgi:PAS domain S-box-containing protein